MVEGRCGESCSVVVLSSGTDLGEPLTAWERTSKKGLIRGPEKASVERGNSRSCTLVVLFSRTASEEPLATAEGFGLGLHVGDRGRLPHREVEDYYLYINFCSLITVMEEPSCKSEGRVRVLSRLRGTSVVEETEGREGRNS